MRDGTAERSQNRLSRVIGRRLVPVLLTLAMAGASASGCSRSSTDTVPENLLGVWTTSDPRYEGRFLDLQPHAVTFGLGTNGTYTHPVSSVEWTSETGQPMYTIYYEEEGTETSISFYFVPMDGTLVFKNQTQNYWIRKPS